MIIGTLPVQIVSTVGGGGAVASPSRFEQAFVGVATIAVPHSLGVFPLVQVIDATATPDVFEPDTISHDNSSNLTVTFAALQSGMVICVAGIAASARFEQPFVGSVSVAVPHNLGVRPVVQILDATGTPDVLIPDAISHDDLNNVTVTFAVAQSGTIVCVA